MHLSEIIFAPPLKRFVVLDSVIFTVIGRDERLATFNAATSLFIAQHLSHLFNRVDIGEGIENEGTAHNRWQRLRNSQLSLAICL